jgi:hypothetical protein
LVDKEHDSGEGSILSFQSQDPNHQMKMMAQAVQIHQNSFRTMYFA